MNMEHWYKHMERVVLFTRWKTCPSTTLATANVTWAALLLNLAPQRSETANYHLCYSKSMSPFCLVLSTGQLIGNE